MSNTIQIKHGEGLPDDGVLKPYELGFDTERQALYIGNENQEPAPVIAEHAYGADYANTAGWAAYASYCKEAEYAKYVENAGDISYAENAKNAEYAETANLDVNGHKLTERVRKIELVSEEDATSGFKVTQFGGYFTLDLRSFSAPRLADYDPGFLKYVPVNQGDDSTPVYFKDGRPFPCRNIDSGAPHFYGEEDPDDSDERPDGTIYYKILG